MRVTLIVNPRSGRGAAARVAGTVASALRAAVPGLAGLRRWRTAGRPAGDHALRTRCAHRRGLA
ncbi:MAG TPA: hypothetical protein VJT72_13370 [Pseudonocardiaceae bacterium]|nr:hypothetical protein [Pseudonocardiaceae bacterium]